MTKIYKDLYQFTDFIQPINLSLHQYLLLTENPILVHTGTVKQVETILPELKQLLDNRGLKYIFVSHFESDECGGLSLLLKEFPEAVTVCSEVCARQLVGFGITSSVDIKKAGDTLKGTDYEFEFVEYPSEVHLHDGLLFIENNRGMLFSSDLMFDFGNVHGEVRECDWKTAVETSGADRIPNKERGEMLLNNLKALCPKFIATGHGPCINVK